MSNILLLEDDLSLINGLSFALKKQGFELAVARTLKEADSLWIDGKYDLLILDVSLPDGTGFEFCKKVRQVSKVPIIFLTAADEEMDIIRNPNIVLTKTQILDKLWDCDGNYIDSSTLTVYMRRLRMKIEDNPSEPQMLLTVRGMGYKWNVIK